MSAPETRFAVLLFTDIVGSTELKARHGVPAFSEALRAHNGHFERLARECHLRILSNAGDSYFAEAGSVTEAVRLALLFQDAMRDGPWSEVRLTARVGIHAGEFTVVDSEGGSGVVAPAADLAARVMSLAVGGQILLTQVPFDEARCFVREHPAVAGKTMPPLRWPAHGPYLMKGREEPLQIFEVGADSLAPLTAPPDGDKAKRAIRPGEEETLGWRPAVGLEIPGRTGWLLTERLGAGGFGEVWTGEHAKLHQRRAFKFCFDDERLRALKREVTLVRLLRSALGERDDIVHIHELKLDAPPFYLESDLAPHGNLLQWAERQGGLEKIPLAQRIALVAHTATALAAAHSIGVLHKDIKPTNILIFDGPGGEPRPRLVDFGIGTLTDRAVLGEHGVTAAGFTRTKVEHSTGTPTYSPPEYLAGKPYTIQGDIYGLGVLLYQLITVKPLDPLAQGWERDIPDPLLREDIAACVDGDPARRLPSAAELAERLLHLDRRHAEITEEERLTREGTARAEAEVEARLADESKRRDFAIVAVIVTPLFILVGAALTVGRTGDRITINSFSLLDLVSTFVTAQLFLGVIYRCLVTNRRDTDLILAFVLLQLFALSALAFMVENTVPSGFPAQAIGGAAATSLLLFRLIYTVSLSTLPTLTHFALRYTKSRRFAGRRVILLYVGMFALSPLFWSDSFMQASELPLAFTSTWACTVPFLPNLSILAIPFTFVWLSTQFYVQWLLWPYRRIQTGKDPKNTRLNMAWVGITLWGLNGILELVFSVFGYAGVGPAAIFQTVVVGVLAVGLARETTPVRKKARVELADLEK